MSEDINNMLKEAGRLFGLATQNEKVKEFLQENKQRKLDISKNIQSYMLNEYCCVVKDMEHALFKDNILSNRFLNQFMSIIQQNNSGGFNDEEMKKIVEKLKSYCDDIENTIIIEYEKFFSLLHENNDGNLESEVKQIEIVAKEERDLLILKYKTLFYEEIVQIETQRELYR